MFDINDSLSNVSLLCLRLTFIITVSIHMAEIHISEWIAYSHLCWMVGLVAGDV